MNLRPKRPEEPDINLVSLIDVVFMLLIFFMLTTTFKDDGRLRLTLPEADAEPTRAEEIELTEVIIDRAGHFYVDKERVVTDDVATLKKALVGAVGAERERPLVIKADADTPHRSVMRALDAATQLGITRVAFAANQTEGGE